MPRIPYVKGLYIPTVRQNRIRELLPKTGTIFPGDIPVGRSAIHRIISQNAAKPQAYATPPFQGAARKTQRSARDMAKRAARREELAAKRKKRNG